MVTANMLSYHADSILRILRKTNMNYEQIRAKIKEGLNRLVEDGRTARVKSGAMDKNERGIMEEWLRQFQRYDIDDYYEGDTIVSDTNRRIAKLFPKLDLEPDKRKEFNMEFIRQYPEAMRAMLAFDKNPNDIAFNSHADMRELEATTPLGELIETFIEAKLRGGKWTENTVEERRRGLSLLVDHFGTDYPVEKITKRSARELRDIINALPLRLKQNDNTRHLSLAETIKVKGLDKIKPKTANEYIGCCSTFGNWLVDEGYLEKNPFSKLKTDIEAGEGERKAYTKEQIAIILTELEHDKIKLSRKTFRYWGVLIGLYMGMRLEEICQLHLSDIVEVESVVCLDINNNEGKRLKSKASKRLIPIPDAILNRGFLIHVDKLKLSGQNRLFPELKRTNKHGYGRALSRWFNTQLLVELEMKEESLVFHSLRHTVATELGEAGTNDSLQKRIMGHSTANDITARYDKSKRLNLMKEALDRLPY